MTTAPTKLGSSRGARRATPGAATVGRKRKAQPKDIRRTPAGRFGAHLEELARQAGLSAKEFGDKLGKTEAAIYSYYRGIRTPLFEDWPKLAKILGLASVRDLIPDGL